MDPTTHDLKPTNIMELIGLSDYDLAVNRSGHISPRQLTKLRRKRTEISIVFAIAVGIFGTHFIYGVVNPSQHPLYLLIAVMGLLFSLVVVLYKLEPVQKI